MKVSELIEQLKLHDPELPVCFSVAGNSDRWVPAVRVCAMNPLRESSDLDYEWLEDSDSDEDDAENYVAIE